jgi:hypothetical protein
VTTLATADPDTAPPAQPAHGLASTDVTSAIYGSMLVTVLIAAQNRAEVSAARVGLYVLLGVFAFWLTHIWATIVGMRLHGRVNREAFGEAAREESPMLAAAVLPFLALGAGFLGVVTEEEALDFALWVAVAQLFLWGVVVGRAIGRPWGSALVVGLVDLALGLGIVALKVYVLH